LLLFTLQPSYERHIQLPFSIIGQRQPCGCVVSFVLFTFAAPHTVTAISRTSLFRKAKVQYATSNVHLIQKPTDSQHTLPPGTKTEKLTMKTPKKNVKCKMWGSQKCRAKKWYWKMRFPLLSQRAVRAFSSSTFFNHVICCWFSSPCIFLSRFSSSPPFDSVLQDSLPVPLAVTTVSD